MGIGADRLIDLAKAARYFQGKFRAVRAVLQNDQSSKAELIALLNNIMNEGDYLEFTIIIEREMAHFTPTRMKQNRAAALRQRNYRAVKAQGQEPNPKYMIKDKHTGQFVGDLSDFQTSAAAMEYLGNSVTFRSTKPRDATDPEVERLIREAQNYKQPEPDNFVPPTEDELFAEPEDK